MDNQDSVTLRCKNCGHTWQARNTPGKARQCSKCRSRRIEEIDPNQTITEEIRPIQKNEVESETASTNDPSPVIDEFADDPDVKAKRKELLMARLDNQINEEQRNPSDETVLRSLLRFEKSISRTLYMQGLLKEEDFLWYQGVCPWCRSCSMEYEEDEKSSQKWRCSECGRII